MLVHYPIANAGAFTQPTAQRRRPRVLPVLGLAGCLAVVAALPARSVLAGLAVLAAGLLARVAARFAARFAARVAARVAARRVSGRGRGT